MNETANAKILDFWNGRAGLGATAGTNDYILSAIERAFLCESIPTYSKVLDLGCGNATSLIQLAMERQCHGVGIDFSPAMVETASEEVKRAGLANRFIIRKCELPPVPTEFGVFDVVYSQRCFINLTTSEDQRQAVQSTTEVLKPGGLFFMIECSIDGSERTNQLRAALGLERIEPPWHNLFMREKAIAAWETPVLKLERLVHLSSTYNLLSRVVYARLARDKNETLRYDSDINLLAAKLPRDIGDFGPVKAWIWRKTA